MSTLEDKRTLENIKVLIKRHEVDNALARIFLYFACAVSLVNIFVDSNLTDLIILLVVSSCFLKISALQNWTAAMDGTRYIEAKMLASTRQIDDQPPIAQGLH